MRGCSRWRWPSVISCRRLVGFSVVVSVMEVWMELAMKWKGRICCLGRALIMAFLVFTYFEFLFLFLALKISHKEISLVDKWGSISVSWKMKPKEASTAHLKEK